MTNPFQSAERVRDCSGKPAEGFARWLSGGLAAESPTLAQLGARTNISYCELVHLRLSPWTMVYGP